ncbi:3-deoxy-7-phosphoheptulonate synthase [Candidatus Woesearchaeota archaeon]|nr:3-deoxy-7-phosphoheptulonate synthase [Candidatus Woesearchaeota archaeon]
MVVRNIVNIQNIEIGNAKVLIAGPCAVDDRYTEIVGEAMRYGTHIARGGAFKPRSSPGTFQGDELMGLERMAAMREKLGIPIVTEATGVTRRTPDGKRIDVLESVIATADMIQIGARSGQQDFLSEVGYQTAQAGNKPILFKRPLGLSVQQYLDSIGYLTQFGNNNIVLCLRGEQKDTSTTTRFKPDMDAIAQIKDAGYPLIYDPSHTTGKRELVIDYAIRGLERGADGVMIEVHTDPDYCYKGERVCDGQQMIKPYELDALTPYLNRRSIPHDEGLKMVNVPT